jgi:thiol-disulfide isomerase/thioredoxin
MRTMTRLTVGRLFAAGLLVAAGASRGALAQEQNGTSPAEATRAAAKPSIYNKSADTTAAFAKATATAKHDDKRVLVMFGGDWCGWCHKLHELFKSDGEIAKILNYEYVLLMVDTEAPGAPAFLEKCKAALSPEDSQKVFGVPFLAVLDVDGKIVTAQRTDPLEEGDHHHPGRVKEFLTKWTVTPKDADLVLREGLSRAASEDKRVFLKFGAPWCGWCHELDNWMAKPEIAAILDRDLVTVRIDIDRMTSGKDVLKRYRPEEKGGIPWFTILDSKGTALGNSDGPQGNIGYPFKPEEIAHFMSLVEKDCPRIEQGDRDKLLASLKDEAGRIEQEMQVRRKAAEARRAAAAAEKK